MKNSVSILYIIGVSILSLNIILVSACNKDVKSYEIAGSVFDPQLSINVTGAKVSLKASKVQSGVYNPNYIEIKSYSTSADGKFNFNIEHESVSGYRLDITKNNYFDASVNLATEDVQNNSETNIKVDLIPIAEITLIVKNTTPQGNDDKIQFRFSNVTVKGKNCWTNDPIIGNGPSYSLTKTGQVSGNKKMYLEWTVTKGGNQHIYKDTIQSEEFNTKTYNINY
ncbi:MAG: hypothetical protein KAG64_03625 [Bacteroidales bacterium]|nr:hypothetical protein [Bacteroidales bacterium]